jgi:dienelactone hydrolase
MIRKTITTFIFFSSLLIISQGQSLIYPDTVTIKSGNLALKALLWHPPGKGKYPAVVFCHGAFKDTEAIYDPVIGPVFARKGYVFLFVFRRGVGLSNGQGVNITDLMDKALKEKGQDERNKVQLQQLETDQLQDILAGLKFLRISHDVDKNRMAVVGVSLGGALALLVAEHEPSLRAAILFTPVGGPGYSWDRSAKLRDRLILAAKNTTMPIMIIQAQNDYSIHPALALDSVMNQFNRNHIVKIYPKFGNTPSEAHNLIHLGIKTWDSDLFKFIDAYLSYQAK